MHPHEFWPFGQNSCVSDPARIRVFPSCSQWTPSVLGIDDACRAVIRWLPLDEAVALMSPVGTLSGSHLVVEHLVVSCLLRRLCRRRFVAARHHRVALTSCLPPVRASRLCACSRPVRRTCMRFVRVAPSGRSRLIGTDAVACSRSCWTIPAPGGRRRCSRCRSPGVLRQPARFRRGRSRGPSLGSGGRSSRRSRRRWRRGRPRATRTTTR